jgi:predicted esterase
VKTLSLVVALAATVLISPPLRAQGRYELGRRLRSFEQAFEQASPSARARAMPEVQGAVMAFFMQQSGRAAKSLDRARFALEEASPQPAERWAAAVGWDAPGRLGDAGLKPSVRLTATYSTVAAKPSGRLVVRWELTTATGVALADGAQPLDRLPLTLKLPRLESGDHQLRVRVVHEQRTVAVHERMLSLVDAVEKRVARATARLDRLRPPVTWEERAAVAHKLALVRSLIGSPKAAETDLPGVRLLASAEQALDALEQGRAFHAGRPGEDWLRLGTAERSAAVRLWVPPLAGPNTPLVVALHGMGGSENMFFDAYGAGAVQALCRERGWLLLAPRTGGGPLSAVLDSLARLHPFARDRVLLVGHSMGAMQASAALTTTPERYAGAAFLAGGGRAGSKPLPPCFVGTGTLDFSAAGAKALARRLQGLASSVEVREYPAEHLTVVQLALPDVFAFFETCLAAKAPRQRWGPIGFDAPVVPPATAR